MKLETQDWGNLPAKNEIVLCKAEILFQVRLYEY